MWIIDLVLIKFLNGVVIGIVRQCTVPITTPPVRHLRTEIRKNAVLEKFLFK